VIGGGLLGVEAAYGLAKAGAGVTLIHIMDRLMERQLDAPAAVLLKLALEAKGVQVLLGADTARILGTAAPRAGTCRRRVIRPISSSAPSASVRMRGSPSVPVSPSGAASWSMTALDQRSRHLRARGMRGAFAAASMVSSSRL